MASSAPPSKVSGDGGGGGGGLPPVALAAAVGGAALAAYVTMKQPPSAATINSNNMFLQGNYAPVTKEIHVTAQTAATARTDSTNSSSSSSPPGLEVIAGSIPADLRGAYVRVGPNPQFKPQAHHHWFDGSGMVHGVCISDAKVKATSDGSGSGSGSGSGTGTGATDSGKPNSVNLSYANHYVRTHRFLEARRVGQDAAIGMGSLLGFYGLVNMAKFAFKVATKRYRKGPAAGSRADDTAPSNTALVFHDRRLLALVEIAAPFALKLAKDGHFESLGVYHYGGQLRHPFTAHPKIDPETGEMVFFGYSMFTKPYMSYGVVSQAGDMVTHFDVRVCNSVLGWAFPQPRCSVPACTGSPARRHLCPRLWHHKELLHPHGPPHGHTVLRHAHGQVLVWREGPAHTVWGCASPRGKRQGGSCLDGCITRSCGCSPTPCCCWAACDLMWPPGPVV